MNSAKWPNKPPIPQIRNPVFANGVDRIHRVDIYFYGFTLNAADLCLIEELPFLRSPKAMGTTLALLSAPLRSDSLFFSGVIMFSY